MAGQITIMPGWSTMPGLTPTRKLTPSPFFRYEEKKEKPSPHKKFFHKTEKQKAKNNNPEHFLPKKILFQKKTNVTHVAS